MGGLPPGVVPRARTEKFRLTVNMRFVNRHMGDMAFKFEELNDLADLAERGDYAVSYDLMSGTITSVSSRRPARMSAPSGEASTTCTPAFPLGSRRSL